MAGYVEHQKNQYGGKRLFPDARLRRERIARLPRGYRQPAKSALHLAPDHKEIVILQAPRAVVTVQT